MLVGQGPAGSAIILILLVTVKDFLTSLSLGYSHLLETSISGCMF